MEEIPNKAIRRTIIELLYRAQTCHLGSDLSCVELLTALYFRVLRPQDKFVMSKGHGAACLYAVLAEKGFFTKEELFEKYAQVGSGWTNLVSRVVPGVLFSTGALGHGLPAAVGFALAQKLDGSDGKTFVLLSDGEMQCGTTWESAMFASHWKLNNLVIVVDYNKLQATGRTNEILKIEPLRRKWESFGWRGIEIEGHNTRDILAALGIENEKPLVVIAHTVKGKGVDFAEDNNDWHYANLDTAHYERAVLQNS